MDEKYVEINKRLKDLPICVNCHFENQLDTHPNCQKCITGRKNGFRPKKRLKNEKMRKL